jgi:flagellar motor switch protein FliG
MADVTESARTAAIVLTLLDEATAVDVLARLDPAEAERLAPAMRAIVGATVDEVGRALGDFVDACQGGPSFGDDAVDRSRRVFRSALGDDCAEAVFGPENAQLQRLAAILRWMPPEAIATILRDEAPQAAALVLSVLDPGRAAQAIAMLDDRLRADLILRAATLHEVDARAVAELCVTLEGQVATPRPAARIPDASLRMARIVGRLPGDVAPAVLKALRKADRLLADAIEDSVVVFDDLLTLSNRDLGIVLRGVDAADLTLALRGSDATEVDRFLACLSGRAGAAIRDELAEATRTKRADVDTARRRMLTTARALAADGTIVFAGLGGGDD